MRVIHSLEEFISKVEAYTVSLELNFYGSRLGPEEAQHIATALRSGNCPQGLTLNLNGNKLGPGGCNILSKQFKPFSVVLHIFS